jgi:type IX secretion system PorP/SprF family membrane protein
VFCLLDGIAQDYHFTQFYANKLYLAPSLAGVNIRNRVIGNYRNQWAGVNGYTTYSLSYDHFFQKYNSGIGLLFIQDQAGDGKLGSQNLGLHYSYDFAITQGFHFRPGVSLSYIKRGIDFDKLYTSSQISPEDMDIATHGINGSAPNGDMDAAVSGLVYTRSFILGLTVDHLLHPNLSYLGSGEAQKTKYALFSVLTIYREGKLIKPIDETISLAANLSGSQKFTQLDFGLYWAKIPLILGVWYRGIPVVNSDRGDSFSFLAGFKFRKFTLGYSYDMPVSNLMVNKTYGSHELSMAVEFAKVGDTRRRKMQRVPCPDL